jgi:hypothetical protein
VAVFIDRTLEYKAATAGDYTFVGADIVFNVGDASLVNVPPYPVTNPTILDTVGIDSDGLASFSVVTTATPPDEVRFAIRFAGIDYWWDGAAWAVSAGYADTNTATEINDNCAELDMSAGGSLQILVYLHSDSGASTPTISSVTYSYGFWVAAPAPPAECVVYGWLLDVNGTPVEGVTVRWKNPSFYHGSYYVGPQDRTVITDPDGYWEFSLIETETIMLAPYNMSLDGISATSVDLEFQNIQVPNEYSTDAKDIISHKVDSAALATVPATQVDFDTGKYDFTISQGSTWRRDIYVRSNSGAAVNLGAATARLQMRNQQYTKDWFIELTTGGGGITIDAPNGKITLELDDADTEIILGGGVYDLELIDFPNVGDVRRVVGGAVYLSVEVTR